MTELIPTKWKEKLPKGFSWPVGAEMLSEAFSGVLKPTSMELYFSWKDTFWASKYNEKIRLSGIISIFDIRYPDFRWGLWYGDRADAKWRISVHAVPSDHRQNARLQMINRLPEIARMIRKAGPEPADFHQRLDYDIATSRLSFPDGKT